ncbi:unnamed protein product [Symbiodinium sp. CCMP2592]|nr:unnamed protein product [Symbiodinium sp. CCMP2592]
MGKRAGGGPVMRRPAARTVAKAKTKAKAKAVAMLEPEPCDHTTEAEAEDAAPDAADMESDTMPVSHISASEDADPDPDATGTPSPNVVDTQADKESNSPPGSQLSEPDEDRCSSNGDGDDGADKDEGGNESESDVDKGQHEEDMEQLDESLIDPIHALYPNPGPNPSAQPKYNLQGSFEKNGFDQLVDWCCQAVRGLPDGMRADLLAMITHDPVLHVATACSGTDGPIMVGRALALAMKQLGAPMQLDHVWSCEKDPMKRAFIRHLFTGMKDPSEDLKSLYEDTASLRAGPGASIHNVLTESIEKLKPCEELWMGFPCQDVSKLNRQAPDNVSVVRQAGKRTGKVFDDAVRFAEATQKQEQQGTENKFRGMILENVMGLLDAPKGRNPETREHWRNNLQYCAHRAKQVGLLMVPVVLKPSLFGMPVTRQRVFMICIPKWMADEAMVTEHEVSALVLQTMNELCASPGPQLRSLNDFLLEENSIFVKQHIQRTLEKAAWRDAQKPSTKKRKWAQVHAKAMQSQGMDWWQASRSTDAVLQSHPGLMALTERQFDLCKIYGIQFPDARDAGVELSQSFRGLRAIQHNTCDTVTPGGQLLLTKKARLTCGMEMMLLQGLHYGAEQFKLMDYAEGQEFLSDLAGNAFNSFCFAASLICKKAVEANLAMKAVVLKRQSMPVAGAGPAQVQSSASRSKPLRSDTLEDLFAWEG